MLSKIVFLLSLSCVCVLSELFTNGSCPAVTKCPASNGAVIPLLMSNKLDCNVYPGYLECVSNMLGECWNTTLNITALTLEASAGNDTSANGTATTMGDNGTATTMGENTTVVQSTVDALVSARKAFMELCGNKSNIIDVPTNYRDIFSKTYGAEKYVVVNIYSDLKSLVNNRTDCKKLSNCTSILQPYSYNHTSEFPCQVVMPFGDCYQENRNACKVNLEKVDESIGHAVEECEVGSASSKCVCFLLLLGAVLWQTMCI